MSRRASIAGLGATAMLPLATRAQTAGMKCVAVLVALAADDPDVKVSEGAFKEGMRQRGWIEGANVQFESRFGAGDTETIRKHVEDLAASAPDAILASGNAAMEAVLRAARTIPIVFVNVADPVGAIPFAVVWPS